MRDLRVSDVREWIDRADQTEIQEFLDEGLADLIDDLEQDDFFGTEGFNKRLA